MGKNNNASAQCPHCGRSVENNTTGFCPHCGATLLSKKRKNSVFCYSMTRRNKIGAVVFSLLTIVLAFYCLYLTSQRVGYITGIESNYLFAKDLIANGSYAMDLEVFKDYQRFEALNTFYPVMAPFMMVFSVLSAFFALMGFLRFRFSFRPMSVLNIIGIFVLIADAGLCAFLGVYTFLISGAVALVLRIIMLAPLGKYASIASAERISYKKAGKKTTVQHEDDNVPDGPGDGNFIFYAQRPSANKFEQQAPVIVQGKGDEMAAVVPFKKDTGTTYEEIMKNAAELTEEMNPAAPAVETKQPEPAKPAAPVVETKQPEPAKPVAPVVETKQPEPAKPAAPAVETKQPEPAKPAAPVVETKQPEPAKPVAPVVETKQPEPAKPVAPVVETKQPEPAKPVAPVVETKQPEPAKPAAPVVETKQPEPAKPAAPVVETKQPEPAKSAAPVVETKQPEPAKPVAPVVETKQPEPAKPVAPVVETKQPEPAKPAAPVAETKQPEPAKPAAPAVETKKPEPIRPMVIRPVPKPAPPKKTAEEIAEEERQASLVNRTTGPWQCPRCGQMNYASSTECMNCGVKKE